MIHSEGAMHDRFATLTIRPCKYFFCSVCPIGEIVSDHKTVIDYKIALLTFPFSLLLYRQCFRWRPSRPSLAPPPLPSPLPWPLPARHRHHRRHRHHCTGADGLISECRRKVLIYIHLWRVGSPIDIYSVWRFRHIYSVWHFRHIYSIQNFVLMLLIPTLVVLAFAILTLVLTLTIYTLVILTLAIFPFAFLMRNYAKTKLNLITIFQLFTACVWDSCVWARTSEYSQRDAKTQKTQKRKNATQTQRNATQKEIFYIAKRNLLLRIKKSFTSQKPIFYFA